MEKWLCRYSFIVVLATFFLILAGGLVTSHEAGLAVPDWPLSYGQWFPPMVGNIFWEHGHRMIAASVGMLTLLLTVWIHFSKQAKSIQILARVALASVILQAVLGGLTVLYMLPPAVSIAHACLAQTFFCMVIAICYALNPALGRNLGEDSSLPPDALRKIRTLFTLTFAFMYAQLIAGAVVRHTGHGIAIHIVIAFLILLHASLAAARTCAQVQTTHFLGRLALALGILLIIQLFLGMGAFIFTRSLDSGYAPSQGEVIFTAAHQTLGAALLGLGFLIVLTVHHGFRIKTRSV